MSESKRHDDDPIEDPHEEDPDFAEIEAPPADKRDVPIAEAMVYAEKVGLA